MIGSLLGSLFAYEKVRHWKLDCKVRLTDDALHCRPHVTHRSYQQTFSSRLPYIVDKLSQIVGTTFPSLPIDDLSLEGFCTSNSRPTPSDSPLACRVAGALTAGGMLAAHAGARLTTKVSPHYLRLGLAVLMAALAPVLLADPAVKTWIIQKLRPEHSAEVPENSSDSALHHRADTGPGPSDEQLGSAGEAKGERRWEHLLAMGVLGLGTGFVSGALGIGGGFIIVPAVSLSTDLGHKQVKPCACSQCRNHSTCKSIHLKTCRVCCCLSQSWHDVMLEHSLAQGFAFVWACLTIDSPLSTAPQRPNAPAAVAATLASMRSSILSTNEPVRFASHRSRTLWQHD